MTNGFVGREIAHTGGRGRGGKGKGGGEVAERWKVCISVTCMRSLFYLENQFETELEFWNTRTTVYHVHIVQLLF